MLTLFLYWGNAVSWLYSQNVSFRGFGVTGKSTNLSAMALAADSGSWTPQERAKIDRLIQSLR